MNLPKELSTKDTKSTKKIVEVYISRFSRCSCLSWTILLVDSLLEITLSVQSEH